MTSKQLKYIRYLILKIKTQAEWHSGAYRLHVGELHFQPFRGNNVLLAGQDALPVDVASQLIDLLKNGLYVVEEYNGSEWLAEEEGVC